MIPKWKERWLSGHISHWPPKSPVRFAINSQWSFDCKTYRQFWYFNFFRSHLTLTSHISRATLISFNSCKFCNIRCNFGRGADIKSGWKPTGHGWYVIPFPTLGFTSLQIQTFIVFSLFCFHKLFCNIWIYGCLICVSVSVSLQKGQISTAPPWAKI